MSKADRTRRTDWFADGVVEQEPDYQRCYAGGAEGYGCYRYRFWILHG